MYLQLTASSLVVQWPPLQIHAEELFPLVAAAQDAKETKIMATKSKASKKRTKVKDIPKSKRELTGKDMRKVKGGLAAQQLSKTSKDRASLNYSNVEADEERSRPT